ncbi:hypothetical protein FQA39_LY10294 [Lamprigera yunnana]|nr:hypothetical protein FQA39_LY10294 [Lamprigera yunnana]
MECNRLNVHSGVDVCVISTYNKDTATGVDINQVAIRSFAVSESVLKAINHTFRCSSVETISVVDLHKTADPPKSVDVRQSTSANEQAPSTSGFIKPSNIRPLPKTTRETKKILKNKKSEILTSSPYKNQLQQNEKQKEEKILHK